MDIQTAEVLLDKIQSLKDERLKWEGHGYWLSVKSVDKEIKALQQQIEDL